MNWYNQPCQTPDTTFEEIALARQGQLTKPPGALGDLESIAIRLSALQKCDKPQVNTIHISIFAGDHGVTEEGVSAFPKEVTTQMVGNFLQGGAAISVLAKALNATLDIVDTGIATPLPPQPGLFIERAGESTANSTKQAAMTKAQLELALKAGYNAAERAYAKQADLFIGGEMGIGNTTAATALYCALLDIAPNTMTGAGTGLDEAGIAHKTQVIEKMLQTHQQCGSDALAWLRCVGGFEVAALVGAYIRCAQLGIPILVDGFISTSAALVARQVQPAISAWMFQSHLSHEIGHQRALEMLEQKPILNLGMRLGEGSGAAVAVPILQAACTTHNNMATFAEAAVAGKLN